MNPLNIKTKKLCDYFIKLENLYPKAYDKDKTNPYTKTRVILMNGTEFESVWFMHQFARHCDNPEICEVLAQIRAQEQQQQKIISCLKPLDESILETTIAYEQLAVDLTACLAKYEKNPENKKALDFALLEDFDHLYRFANLLKFDKGINAKNLVGELTEIMPGRPTIAEHRFPKDNLRKHMNSCEESLYSKLVACIITAAEQQTMNYYMNIAQWYKNDIGRQLYSEIALVEEEHVSQYESLKDPNMSWLEQWVMHEYTESYLYYSAMEDEVDKNIRKIWETFFETECAHLKEAIRLLEKYEKKSYKLVFGEGEYPILLKLCSNIDYVREVIKNTITLTSMNKTYIDTEKMPKNCDFCFYQDLFVGDNAQKIPSHKVIKQYIEKNGKDYRYETKNHPILELQDRCKDNTDFARKGK